MLDVMVAGLIPSAPPKRATFLAYLGKEVPTLDTEIEVTVEADSPPTEESETEEAVEGAVTEVVLEEALDLEGRVSAIEATYVTRDDLAVVAASINALGSATNERLDDMAEEIQEEAQEEAAEDIEETVEELAELQNEQEETTEPTSTTEDDEPPLSFVHRWWRSFGSKS